VFTYIQGLNLVHYPSWCLVSIVHPSTYLYSAFMRDAESKINLERIVPKGCRRRHESCKLGPGHKKRPSFFSSCLQDSNNDFWSSVKPLPCLPDPLLFSFLYKQHLQTSSHSNLFKLSDYITALYSNTLLQLRSSLWVSS